MCNAGDVSIDVASMSTERTPATGESRDRSIRRLRLQGPTGASGLDV
jgi:hypothetical protein